MRARVTIPASIAQDSQYPFSEGDNSVVIVEPDHEVIIISREGVYLQNTQNGVHLFKPGPITLPAEFRVLHPKKT